MAQAVQIKIENLDKLVSLAGRMPALAEKMIGEAIVRSIAEVQKEAQPLTPVKTRRLWGELQVPYFKPFQGWFGSNLDYAGYVHGLEAQTGLRYKNPSLNKSAVRGFLRIAVKNAQPIIDKAFKDALIKLTKAMGD